MSLIKTFTATTNYGRNSVQEAATRVIPAFDDISDKRFDAPVSSFIAYLLWKHRSGFQSQLSTEMVILKKIDDFISRYDQSVDHNNARLNEEAAKWSLTPSTLELKKRNAQVGLTNRKQLVIVWDGIAFILKAVQPVVKHVLARTGNGALACLIGIKYHNMRFWSATNGSPIEFYANPVPDAINAECFASLMNNQNYLRGMHMDWVFTKTPEDKLVDSFIKGSWPKGVLQMLKTTNAPVVLWVNPPFIADVMETTVGFILSVRKKHPNVIIRTCFPTWDDVILPLVKTGEYTQKKYLKTRLMRNGDDRRQIPASFYVGWFSNDPIYTK